MIFLWFDDDCKTDELMNVYAKLLDSNLIRSHHCFIKALTKRENHHLPYSAWSA